MIAPGGRLADAQRQYAAALAVAPGHPAARNNAAANAVRRQALRPC